jgi:hypothetical protein
VQLVGLIIKKCVTMHGHMDVNIAERCVRLVSYVIEKQVFWVLLELPVKTSIAIVQWLH